ncbi:hypothetical protein EYF80_045983 [Liparis tanakae]|uniref:Uncharacterized protein n=1 Tax=Liparis tanakae TaxID=230148 RepID=A0A4Z2FRE0_9TELE|nr:hypothetical protein EYF80_045983 [Liparis tanakae]
MTEGRGNDSPSSVRPIRRAELLPSDDPLKQDSLDPATRDASDAMKVNTFTAPLRSARVLKRRWPASQNALG